jgi:hypothetical protein
MRRIAIRMGLGAAVLGYLIWALLRPPTGGPALPTPAVGTPVPGIARNGERASVPAPADPTPAVAPTLLLGAGRATRGTVIAASGFGFAPREPLRLWRQDPFGTRTLLTITRADEHGGFAGLGITVADRWPNGMQTLTIEGVTSQRRATARFVLVGSPPAGVPDTYAGKPFSAVSFSGGGFGPYEEVDVYFDSIATSALGRFTADGTGTVHITGIRVPMAAPGSHAFVLLGEQSRAPVRVPYSVLPFSPWIGLSAYAPQPEQAIGVTGHDFAPGETVAIFLGPMQGRPIATARAGSDGQFRLEPAVVIPYDRRGPLQVVAVGTISQTVAAADLTVRPYTPTVQLSRYAGPPGTTFRIRGQGFARSEDVQVALGEGDHPLVTVLRTDARGYLSSDRPLRIPSNASPGRITVNVEGAHSHALSSVTFAITPPISR